jgi:multicomponent Na+:H+ antiporter subunit B
MDSVFPVDLLLLALVVVIGVATIRARNLLASTLLLGVYSLLMALVWTNMFAMDVAFTEAAVGAGISTVLLLGTLIVVGREERPSRGPHGAALLVTILTGAALLYGTTDMPAFGDPNAPVHTDAVGRKYIAQEVGKVHPVAHHHDDTHHDEAHHDEAHHDGADHSADDHEPDTSAPAEHHGGSSEIHVDPAQDAHHGDYGTHVPNLVTAVLAAYRGYDTMFETAVIFTAGVCLIVLLRDRRSPPKETEAAA